LGKKKKIFAFSKKNLLGFKAPLGGPPFNAEKIFSFFKGKRGGGGGKGKPKGLLKRSPTPPPKSRGFQARGRGFFLEVFFLNREIKQKFRRLKRGGKNPPKTRGPFFIFFEKNLPKKNQRFFGGRVFVEKGREKRKISGGPKGFFFLNSTPRYKKQVSFSFFGC